MEKKKSFEEEMHLLKVNEQRAKKIFSIIEGGLIGLVVLCAFLYWQLAFGIFFFLLWSEYWYARGRDKWVTDEYEKGGYPTEGLRTMFISWGFLAVAAIIIYLCW